MARSVSTHLLIAAAYLEDLPQGTKLVLMAIADSGDEHTLEAAPGLPKLRAWSGLGKSQTLRVVAQLAEAGHIKRILPGRVGRRAVYSVFPNGVPAIPHPSEVAARYATEDLSTPGDELVENPESRVAPMRPSENRGSHETPGRVAPMRPLHADTSVSTRVAPSTGRQPTTSAASGFPGSRSTAEEDKAIARRARGAHDQACPFHADQIVPCGRCAHAAANSDPAKVAEARQLARAATRAAKTHTAQPTTEEPTP